MTTTWSTSAARSPRASATATAVPNRESPATRSTDMPSSSNSATTASAIAACRPITVTVVIEGWDCRNARVAPVNTSDCDNSTGIPDSAAQPPTANVSANACVGSVGLPNARASTTVSPSSVASAIATAVSIRLAPANRDTSPTPAAARSASTEAATAA